MSWDRIALKLCEPPFDSMQGEYPLLGAPVRIVRFAGCNLGKDCPLPCDTKYSWPGFKSDDKITWINEVFSGLPRYSRLMITGGEPFLHYEAIDLLMERWAICMETGIIIETNGMLVRTIEGREIEIYDAPGSYRVKKIYFPDVPLYLSISPKHLDSFSVFENVKYPNDILSNNIKISMKLVVGQNFPPEDWASYVWSAEKRGFPIYLMPMGTSLDEMKFHLDYIYGLAKRWELQNFIISPRCHILLGVR
jgi:organic radical activating enzyme